VVIAIIGILIGLLLPAVQSAREAARRTQCSNHLKQITLAMLSYETAHSAFPPGQYVYIDHPSPVNWNRYSWFYSILPYIEQKPMYEVYKKHLEGPKTGGYCYTHLPCKKQIVAEFMCPSDTANPQVTNGSSPGNQQGFHGNYMLNAGDDYFNPGGYPNSANLNGLFYVFSATAMRDIKDGTTHTLFASEINLSPDGPVSSGKEDIRGRYHNVRHAGALFSTKYPPNTSQPDRHNYCISTQRAPCTPTGTDVIVSARSQHPGGVNASLADGSTRFIANDVDPDVFKNYGTRDGKEVASGEL
jgi:type II secretory pathway pseudopilin PulG